MSYFTKVLMYLLYKRISKNHNLREIQLCKLCKSFFDLRNELENKKI